MTNRDTLADLLRQKIINGDFLPGQRLSEAALATQFEVSRNTLRETFRSLTEQGLLDHVPNRGVSVCAPTVTDVVDIYLCRRTIECTAMQSSHPDHPAVQRMIAAVDLAESQRRQNDWQGIGSANMAFHSAVVDLADSARLTRMFRNLAAELRLIFLTINDPQAVHGPFLQGNRHILNTFVTQGPSTGAKQLERYLQDSQAQVLRAFTRAGLP